MRGRTWEGNVGLACVPKWHEKLLFFFLVWEQKFSLMQFIKEVEATLSYYWYDIQDILVIHMHGSEKTDYIKKKIDFHCIELQRWCSLSTPSSSFSLLSDTSSLQAYFYENLWVQGLKMNCTCVLLHVLTPFAHHDYECIPSTTGLIPAHSPCLCISFFFLNLHQGNKAPKNKGKTKKRG